MYRSVRDRTLVKKDEIESAVEILKDVDLMLTPWPRFEEEQNDED